MSVILRPHDCSYEFRRNFRELRLSCPNPVPSREYRSYGEMVQVMSFYRLYSAPKTKKEELDFFKFGVEKNILNDSFAGVERDSKQRHIDYLQKKGIKINVQKSSPKLICQLTRKFLCCASDNSTNIQS